MFYIGVDNPITVTAAGYSLEDVSVGIDGAQLKNTGKGKYDVTVPMSLMGKEVTANIVAKTPTGNKSVGTMKVRVKRIPDPIAKVAGKSGTFVLPASTFRAQLGVAAVLENFDFATRFDIVSYEFSYVQRRKEYQAVGVVNGPLFSSNPQVVAYMKAAAIGDRIFIDNIKARGPDGSIRQLGSITILLN